MAGRKNRPRRLTEESKTWNIVFPLSLISLVNSRAEKTGVTPAAVVREAVKRALSRMPINDETSGDEVMRGVQAAIATLRSVATEPKYPSGNTLGDVLAQKIIKTMENEGPHNQ